MYELTKNDIFAEELTNAYEDYDKEFEVKILIEIDPNMQIKKFGKELNFDDICYVLITINKKYKTISYISTEYLDSSGNIHFLSCDYSPKEKELLKNYAISKWKESFTKKI